MMASNSFIALSDSPIGTSGKVTHAKGAVRVLRPNLPTDGPHSKLLCYFKVAKDIILTIGHNILTMLHSHAQVVDEYGLFWVN